MMEGHSYETRRQELFTYFDDIAVDAWEALTSTEKVSRIRETVRRGRDQMRDTLTGWLDADLRGRSVLDAGCGTGSLSLILAARGAHVTAIDLSPRMIEIARQRQPRDIDGTIDWASGDMLQRLDQPVDHSVAMDSLIHYSLDDKIQALTQLASQTRRSIVFTFAPATPLLRMMHSAGKLFPRANRAPAIIPVSQAQLTKAIHEAPGLRAWRVGRTRRISSGFYTSQAMELIANGAT